MADRSRPFVVMTNLSLVLAFAVQLVAPQPSFMYREGPRAATTSSCGTRIARKCCASQFRPMRGESDAFVPARERPADDRGPDLGLPFDQVLAGRAGRKATSRSVLLPR